MQGAILISIIDEINEGSQTPLQTAMRTWKIFYAQRGTCYQSGCRVFGQERKHQTEHDDQPVNLNIIPPVSMVIYSGSGSRSAGLEVVVMHFWRGSASVSLIMRA